MFSTLVLAATTLRESVQLVGSLVTGAAFAVACIVAVHPVVAALKARRGLKQQHCNQNRKKKPIEIDKEK